MRGVGVLVALAAAVALQLTMARFVIAQGRVLDLVLILVIYVGLAMGPLAGLVTGTVAGLIQDLLSGGVVGVGGLAKSVVGFLVGVTGQQFIVTHTVPRFFMFCLGTLLQAALVIGVYGLIDPRNLAAPYGDVLTQSLGNGLVGVVVFRVTEMLPSYAERRRARSRVHRRWS